MRSATSSARYVITALTLGFLLLGIVSSVRVVGADRIVSGSAQQPIVFDDYALQFYYGQLGGRFLERGGVTYGYDPSFLAGYPKTPIYYPSSKPFEFALGLFSFADPIRVFNLSVLLMLCALPLIVYGAARNFGLTPGERLGAVAMAVMPHFMVPMAGFYGIMEAAGMVPYIFASFLSIYVVSLVYRFLDRGGSSTALALLLTAPLLYMTHLTAIVISAVPIAALYVGALRRAPWRRHVFMWAVVAAILVFNWSWIQGHLLYAHYGNLDDFYSPEGATHFVPAGGWLAPFHVYVASPRFLSLIPPVFGIAGLWLWWRAGQRALLLVFLPQIAFLFVVSFYGARIGLNALAPARITLPLGIYLFIPAAVALAAFVSWAWRASARLEPASRRLGLRSAVGIVLIGGAIWGGLPAKIWRPFTLPMLEDREGYTEHGMQLIEWLRARTDTKGRLLHEETDRNTHRYFGSHMAALIPYYTDIEMAGGPAPHALIEHNFLRFIAGRFRDEPIQRIPPRKLAAYLDLYNVRWVLCWTPAAKRRFGRLPFATRVGEYEKFSLYRLDREPSYFLKGDGRVEIRDGTIALSDVVPEADVAVIKYHWLESLRSEPPRRLIRHFALDDPIPFIGIEDPPPEIVIYEDPDYGIFDASAAKHAPDGPGGANLD